MMKNKLETYRFTLDESSSKFCCPACRKKRFVRYVDVQTGNYLPKEYGRCDREVNCGYFCSPYNDSFAKQHFGKLGFKSPKVISNQKRPPKFIPEKLFRQSFNNYKNNSLVKYLLSLFDREIVKKMIKKYHIGTSSKIKGGCIFYQVDEERNIRRGKIIVYDFGGHKQSFNSVHAQLGWTNCKPDYCYFGQHLLYKSNKPVAIVESEKTAVIASIYFPQFTWLATGSKNRLNVEHGKCLAGKQVILYPDLGAYAHWQAKAEKLS